MSKSQMIGAAALWLAAIPLATATSAPSALSLQALETRAVQRDERPHEMAAMLEAAQARIETAAELPDPRLRLGLNNLPVDSFRLDQADMTQVAVGVQQRFPAGRTRALRRERADTEAATVAARLQRSEREVRREVRTAWLEGHAATARLTLLEALQPVRQRTVAVTEAAYAAGQGAQAEVRAAQLELTALAEQALASRGQREAARARLERWLDPGERIEWDEALPALLRELPRGEVARHPELQELNARGAGAAVAVDLAREAYKPDWGIEAGYGFRDGRADFISFGVDIALPFFTERRQDPALLAAERERLAVGHAAANRDRELSTRFAALRATADALQARLALYDAEILPQRLALTQVTRTDYQSGRGALRAVLEAEAAEIEARLRRLELEVERAGQIIEVRYLAGETPA
ncbi:MAG: TolC family protein [Thiotrichales bacterium]